MNQLWLRIALAVALTLVACVVVVTFFEQFPIENTWLGIDWHYFHAALENLQLNYDTGSSGLRIPPWSALAILPLGLLSFRASWGLITLITLAVLVLSVPRSGLRLWIIGILLLVTAHPSLRNMADGNLEALTIAGVLLTLYAYNKQKPLPLALGLLLVTAKPQEAWLFVLVIGIFALRNWPARHWKSTALIVLTVVVLTMLWRGVPWIQAIIRMPQRNGPEDMSLISVLGRLDLRWALLPAWAVILIPTCYFAFQDSLVISRAKAAMLLAASCMLSPYTSGISYLAIFAVGVIPLLQSRPLIALLVVVLSNVPYFFSTDTVWNYGNYYSTFILLLVWAIMIWQVCTESHPPKQAGTLLPIAPLNP